MDWLLSVRNILEVIYFISGPVLAIGLIIALLQYFQIKKDIISKYEREIANSTIRDVHNFNINIESMYEEYLDSLNGKLDFKYEDKYHDFNDEKLNKASIEFYDSISNNSILKVKELAQEMNKFSLSFIFLISDDSQAKQFIGSRYIEIFESILFIFSIMTIKNRTNIRSILKLYNNWNNENLINETKQKLDDDKKRLAELEDAVNTKLKPIGR